MSEEPSILVEDGSGSSASKWTAKNVRSLIESHAKLGARHRRAQTLYPRVNIERMNTPRTDRFAQNYAPLSVESCLEWARQIEAELFQVRSDAGAMLEGAAAVEKERNNFAAALKFYASQDAYAWSGSVNYSRKPEVLNDGGKRATDALSASEDFQSELKPAPPTQPNERAKSRRAR
jgi:hypothetical protein